MQDAVFGGDRLRTEIVSQFMDRVVPKLRELEASLRAALPPELFGALLKKQEHLSEAQRTTIHTLSRGDLRLDALLGHLRGLDQLGDVLKSVGPGSATKMAATPGPGSSAGELWIAGRSHKHRRR